MSLRIISKLLTVTGHIRFIIICFTHQVWSRTFQWRKPEWQASPLFPCLWFCRKTEVSSTQICLLGSSCVPRHTDWQVGVECWNLFSSTSHNVIKFVQVLIVVHDLTLWPLSPEFHLKYFMCETQLFEDYGLSWQFLIKERGISWYKCFAQNIKFWILTSGKVQIVLFPKIYISLSNSKPHLHYSIILFEVIQRLWGDLKLHVPFSQNTTVIQ